MPCDRAFAQIEEIKRKKKYLFVPDEWYDIVSSASINFTVVKVNQEMILDYKNHVTPFFKRIINNGVESFSFIIS